VRFEDLKGHFIGYLLLFLHKDSELTF